MEGKEKRRKEGNRIEKGGKYPYFVSLFNVGPYNRQKSLQKKIKNQKLSRGGGGGRFSLVARIYTPGQIQTAWMFARTLSFDYWESQLKTFVMFNSL